jgi:hypothetical protein
MALLRVDVQEIINLYWRHTMGKQYNKVEKRSRRKAYVERRKAKLKGAKK